MVIEPGVFDINSQGKVVDLESVTNIKSKLDSQAYNSKILSRFEANPKELTLRFKTTLLKGSSTIMTKVEETDVSKGVQVLSALFHEIANEYQPYVDTRKLEVDQEIAKNERKISAWNRGKKNDAKSQSNSTNGK